MNRQTDKELKTEKEIGIDRETDWYNRQIAVSSTNLT